MVSFAVAATLSFAVYVMALSANDMSASAAVVSTRDELQPPKAESPEDFKKWLMTVAEAAEELRKMAEEVANDHGEETN